MLKQSSEEGYTMARTKYYFPWRPDKICLKNTQKKQEIGRLHYKTAVCEILSDLHNSLSTQPLPAFPESLNRNILQMSFGLL